MKSLLCITVRFLQPYSHGRGEDGDPEWPPSPLRLLQALVAASAGRWNERTMLQQAAPTIRWLEMLPPPQIIAVPAMPTSNPYRLYVPDNVADKVAASWCRGRDSSIADYRAEKDVRPVVIDGETAHYLFELPAESTVWHEFVSPLVVAARSVTHLGWGIDMAVGDASIISAEDAAKLEGLRWYPSSSGGTPLRVPKSGTLDDLMRKHRDFLGRLTTEGFRPVPPLRVFDVVHYRRQDEPLSRPYRVFELRSTDGSRFRYPHRKLIHIAGMVRHLAIEAMTKDPPRGIDNAAEWVESYVAGHQPADEHQRGEPHRQLSYLPLPSVGHEHTDPGVRRVMIAAQIGDDEGWLDHIARRLAGQLLKPEPGKPDPFAGREPPLLVPMPRHTRDGVVRCYTGPATVWHSITPVILPGHDDHKPAKTRKLIEKALAQSGVDQPCEFEWSAFSRFRKSYTAHKYNRQKEPQGYFRPDHLSSQTAVHLTVRFGRREVPSDPTSRWIAAEPKVPGPFVIGAGRHCGLGLLVAELKTTNTGEHNGRSQ